ncbi:hypothetical protein [Celerinatantimonas sp. MCCC 1A17872]|uniref:hypothetical protein n=1 Tax=Celerinatantimonas sp. MCCC 1A17872 TaxID=3177514 RepID=UPI0038BEC43D
MSFPLQAKPTIHDGLDALWHHHYQKAEQVFQKLGEQGNAHAMYWLGNTYQLEGRMKRLDAGRILLKAAKMGDPWAMYRLYSKNPYSLCTVWPCDSKWDSKAAAIWERQSKQGNGKATFALALRKDRTFWYNVTKWLPGLGQERLNKMALTAFHQGYQGASFYLFNNSKFHDLKYFQQAANNNFIPAYGQLAIFYRKGKKINLMKIYREKAIESGDVGFINYLFEVYLQGLNGYNKDYKKAYFYGKILSYYGKNLSNFFTKDGFKQYRLNAKITNDTKLLLTQKAKAFFYNHPPYHYYDEFSLPFYAINFNQ